MAVHELLDLAQQLRLVTECHVTDWSISFHIGDAPFVMTQGQAQPFLQGLLIGHCTQPAEHTPPVKAERPLTWLTA